MRAILGLGNPGPEYRRNRHNLGFLVVDRLAERVRVGFRQEGPLALGAWRPAGTASEILLGKPSTFMNRSGAAALHLRDHHDIPPAELLVVVDDLDLPFSRLRLRPRGGAGTHNGLRSIHASLEGEEFARLRVGIGPAPDVADLSEWVLEDFSGEQERMLPELLDRAADCLVTAVSEGMRPAMNRFNAGA